MLCTSSVPCATITQALSRAVSGDTIEVAGTIKDNVVLNGPFTSLTITQWPGQAPAVVDGQGGQTTSAIAVQPGNSVTLHQLTIDDGVAPFGGGGIYNRGTITVTDSTIAHNSASGAGAAAGGGIANVTGTVTVTDSTIAHNSATGGGGGIFNNGGTVTVTDSTIAHNSTANSGGAGIDNQGDASGAITLGATIIANNTGSNCAGGGFVSAGYNLTDGTGSSCGLSASTHDLVDANPELGLLEDNGGPTETMAPAAGSPATGAIPLNTTLSGVEVCPGTDQRGVSQPIDGTNTCSVGAVAVALRSAPTITSPATTTFAVGKKGSFEVTATGSPTPSYGLFGVLPRGVIFSNNGLLSGTPARGTGGRYTVATVAQNGVAPDAIQYFTLVVNEAPRFTNHNAASFVIGRRNVFSFTTAGNPASHYSLASALPQGVHLSRSGVLSGVPAKGTAGRYLVSVVARNGVGKAATQRFYLTISRPRAVLGSGQVLSANHQLVDGPYRLVMQEDGNLVLYQETHSGLKALWWTNTAAKRFQGDYLVMQRSDGNLVLYSAHHHPLWWTNTAGHPGSVAALWMNGQLIVFSHAGVPLWSTGS